jgi:adenylate cyclase
MKKTKHRLIGFQLIALLALTLYSLPHFLSDEFGLWGGADALLSDWKFRVRGPKPASGNVVVIAIDRPSIEALGRWPWKRHITAELTERLFKLGVENVGYDMGFIERQADESHFDSQFEEVLKRHGNKITLSWWTHNLCGEDCSKEASVSPPFPITPSVSNKKIPQFEKPELNYKLFSEAVTSQGFGNATKDPDGQARNAFYFLRDVNGVYPSFPLALIAQRLERSPESLVNVAGSPIDYLGPAGSIPRYSAFEMMQLADRELASDELPLKGKTAIIGLTAFGLVDEQVSPFDRAIHGVEIQASIADQILRQAYPVRPGADVWVVTLFVSLVLLGTTLFFKTRSLIFLFLGSLGAIYFVDFHWMFPNGYHCPTALLYANVALIAVSTFSGRFYEEFRQRLFLKDAFAKYLAPDVVQILLSHPEALSLGGEKKEITTLFCDLRNFTSLSEKLEPSQLTQVLNETFTILTAVIFKHQGTVDKYIGDALMAFFGAPLEQPDHALRACLAAKEMVFEFKKKQSDFQKRFGIELKLGIGINTGIAHVGNMGSEQRFNYTVLGDSVNIASRVESCTKEYGVTILTTQATLDSIRKNNLEAPSHKSVATTLLKGKSAPLELFEIELTPKG